MPIAVFGTYLLNNGISEYHIELREYYSQDYNEGKIPPWWYKIPFIFWTKYVMNIAESKLIIICDQEMFFDYLDISWHLIEQAFELECN